VIKPGELHFGEFRQDVMRCGDLLHIVQAVEGGCLFHDFAKAGGRATVFDIETGNGYATE
jgi:hypothetical protein